MWKILSVMIASAAPVSELRGGIPLGLALGLNPWLVIATAFITNTFIFFPLYFGLEFLHHRILYKFSIFNSALRKAYNKRKKIEKYGVIGLVFYVAVPLPFTGAWTGTLIAWALRLDWKKSFIAIAIGVGIAAVIVSSISLGILTLKFLL